MYVIQDDQSLPAKELTPNQAKSLSSKLAQSILKSLSHKPTYPKQIAKTLQVHEQKVYYHIRKLEKANIIEQTQTKIIGGTPAHIYKLKQPAFIIKFKEFQTSQHITEPKKEEKAFLEPFIEDGQLNATIIVGSPDPHGPEKARSRDGFYGIDLALFIGSYLN
jgi:predicted transcriptional regulator